MPRSTDIADRIANFVPRGLSADEWALAGPAARALVRAAAPTSSEDAKCLLSSLCTFLRWRSCGWDRSGTPDLGALLAEASIDAFSAGFGGHRRTLSNHVGRLRALRRALVGIKREPARRTRAKAPRTTPTIRVHAACPTIALPTFAAVVERATGAPLTRGRLSGLVSALLDDAPANVTVGSSGTVPSDQRSRDAYLGAEDCEPSKEVVRATAARRADPRKPLSRRQALALERAERAAIRRLRSGPRVAEAPDPGTLDATVVAAIQKYRPLSLPEDTWRTLRPLTMRLVMGYAPASVVSARNAASIVVPFLQWVWSLPDRPDPAAAPDAAELLATPLVEAYAGPGGSWMHRQARPSQTISTARTVLRRCVRSLDADRQDVHFAYSPIDGPYSPAECDRFVWIALAQPTPTKERNACFLLGLCLGAGLSAADLRLLRHRHIAERIAADGSPYLVVIVPEAHGTPGREVPIRRAYEDVVRRAQELSAGEGPDALVLGRKATRRNVTIVARRGLVTARVNEPVEIQVHRLRTTWLFACMNTAVPLADLLRMAGLRSARSLADLLPLCPPADAEAVAELALQVRDAVAPSRPAVRA